MIKKTRNNGRWTESQFNSFIKGLLRRGSIRWGVRADVLNKAKRGKKVNKKTKRIAMHYECNICHKLFPLSNMDVDHIIPIIKDEFTSWDDVINKMYCEEDNLQVICKDCHKEKTKSETEKRKLYRRSRNKNADGK